MVDACVQYPSFDLVKSRKNCFDESIRIVFLNKLTKLLTKYDTLNRTNTYKKITRANILVRNEDVDNILGILNKITIHNYKDLYDKIITKHTSRNTVGFVKQILEYGTKSDIPKILAELICILVKNNHGSKDKVEQYVFKFVRDTVNTILDTSRNTDISKERYDEFVDRNSSNKTIIRSVELCYAITMSTLDDGKGIGRIFEQISHALDFAFVQQNQQTVDPSNLLECIHIIVLSKPIIRRIGVEFIKERTSMWRSKASVFSNKSKFKVYDICDLISKL